MKILIYRWNSYNQNDIESAFKDAGCVCDIFNEKISNYENDPLFCQKLYTILKKGNYDFCFSINFFPLISEVCHDTDTLYVSWNCDAPLLAMYHRNVFFDTNIIFEFDYNNLIEFKNMGVTNIYYLPLAANVKRYDQLLTKNNPFTEPLLPKSTDTLHEYTETDSATYPVQNFSKPAQPLTGYDISFVGSLYEKNSYDKIQSDLPDYLTGYLDGAIFAQTQVSGGNILENLLTPEICSMIEEITDYKKSDDSFVTTKKLFSTTVLGFKAASVTRTNNLNKLSKNFIHKVHLFTDSDTSTLPLITAHPRVDYLTEMPFIFNKSKININMTIPNISSGLSLRVWDIIGCHGLLMTDFRPELLNFFKPDEDIVIYEDSNELIDKTSFYLKHDELRNKVTDNAYKKVSVLHTTEIRISEIIKTIKTFL